MSRVKKQAARIDVNQPEIVEELRRCGVKVEVDHDDILCGYNGKTLWVEVKAPDTWKKTGGLKSGTFKDNQIGLLKTWNGAYMVAWNAEQIKTELGIK